MTTQTADPSITISDPKVGLNRFDSPWLNQRFIIGFVMIGFVILVGVFGPLFWDTRLALVGTSPLNVPPMWVSGREIGIKSESTPVPATVVAATPNTTGGFGASGLGGSGLAQGLMQTSTAAVTTATPNTGGFGASGLGGSGLAQGLMQTSTAAVATATPNTGGFGASGLGGSGLAQGLMQTSTADVTTPTPAQGVTQAPAATPKRLEDNSTFGDASHPLGTDDSGRDILAVLIVGAPASLRVGFIAALVGMLVGIVLGFSAGFIGGRVDTVIRTASDVAFTIPSLAVLLVISAYMKRVDLDTMALLLALFSWPVPTRLIRAQVLTLRERGYVKMAQLSGLSTFDIMFREMLPNMLPYLAASLVGNISGAILAATSLEALGLGPTRYPTLGTTLFNALRSTAIMRNMWWWWGFPVLTLFFIFTGLFQIATGLDEIANPRLRGVTSK
jgi:peptide/nickel transport system permease protein